MKKIVLFLVTVVIHRAPIQAMADRFNAPKTTEEILVENNIKTLLKTKKCIGCSLMGAFLKEFDLSGAELQGANLREANLHKADLSSADLSDADLSGANIKEANFNNTILTNTKLYNAYTGHTPTPWSAYILRNPVFDFFQEREATH